MLTDRNGRSSSFIALRMKYPNCRSIARSVTTVKMRSSATPKPLPLPSQVPRHASLFFILNEGRRWGRRANPVLGRLLSYTTNIKFKQAERVLRGEDGFVSTLSIRGFGSFGSITERWGRIGTSTGLNDYRLFPKPLIRPQESGLRGLLTRSCGYIFILVGIVAMSLISWGQLTMWSEVRAIHIGRDSWVLENTYPKIKLVRYRRCEKKLRFWSSMFCGIRLTITRGESCSR